MGATRRFFLLGPTASGKTAVSLALAPKLNAEILSLDSMLVYRGMDIGTAKPSRQERAVVPHHLLDLVEPSEEFSVQQYLQHARAIEAKVAARGKSALYVGGTTMWFKALVFGLLEVPQASQELQNELQSRLEIESVEALRLELWKVDPEAHARIHPHDTRRLLRALETWYQTGKALSEWQSQWNATTLNEPTAFLHWPRQVLHERVQLRFQQMLEQGLVDEVRGIRESCGFGRTAAKAIGYQQVLQYLEGRCSLEEAVQKGITKTNVLIRRQMTWLRSFASLHRVDMTPGLASEEVAEKLARLFSTH